MQKGGLFVLFLKITPAVFKTWILYQFSLSLQLNSKDESR